MSAGQNGAIWLGAGAIAAAVHLALVQQGLAAYSARNSVAPPPVMPQVEIMAVASSVAGEERPIETVAAVQSQSLTAISATDRAAPVSEVGKAETAVAASAASLAPSLSANVAAASAAPKLAPLVSAALKPKVASSVTPSRPVAPSVATVKSTASIVAPLPKQSAGLATPRAAPVAVAPSTVRAAAPSVSRVAAALAPPTAKSTAAIAPSAAAPETIAATPSVTPVGTSSATESIAAVAAAVPSLPPKPDVAAQEGVAAPQPQQTPQENALTYQSVLDILAEIPKAACFAALPTLSDDSTFQLEVFAQSEDDLTTFAAQLETRIGQPPNTTMKPISAAQCAAAAYITEGPSYPRFKLFFEIETRDIKSGEALKGRIGNTSGGFISFLVIDDEGTVQDLAGYLQFTPGGAQFRIPLSLTGSPVVTQQLLMAISSPVLLRTVIDMNGAKAQAFFPALAAELREKGHAEDVALVAFSVE